MGFCSRLVRGLYAFLFVFKDEGLESHAVFDSYFGMLFGYGLGVRI